MCIYIDSIEKRNLSNDQCCFRVEVWGVYTACLSCNNFVCFFLFFSPLFVNEPFFTGPLHESCNLWTNNCVSEPPWSGGGRSCVCDCIHTKLWTLWLSLFFSFSCCCVPAKSVCEFKSTKPRTHFALKVRSVNFSIKQNCAENQRSSTTPAECLLWKLLVRHYESTHQRISIYICLNKNDNTEL